MIFERLNRLFARKPMVDAEAEAIDEARALFRNGQQDKALGICRDLLNRLPQHYEAICLAAEIAAGDDVPKALESYARAIELAPEKSLGYYKRANILRSCGRTTDALDDYDKAIARSPDFANAFCNRGVVLQQLNRLPEALDSYRRAIDLNPADAFAHFNRGTVLRELGRFEEAKKSFVQAIALKPDFAECYCNLGLLQADLKEWQAALASYDRCIELNPEFVHAHFSRGVLQQSQMEWKEALTSYDRTLELKPDHAEAYSNRGVLLTELRQPGAAAASLEAAISLRPDFAEAYYNRGNLLAQVARHREAVASYDRAIELKPGHIGALQNRADALLQVKQFAAAIESFDAAIRTGPQCQYLLGMRIHAQMNICEWSALKRDLGLLAHGIEAGESLTPPFPLVALLDQPALQLKAAQIWARDRCSVPLAPTLPLRYPAKDRLRLGYFSSDFCNHPVSMLLAGVIERHDRSQFEVIAFSYGPDTQDDMRRRLERSFDRFIDVRNVSDREVALMARSLEIDIAVDLAGYTGNGRTKIFAWRAAPLQLNYLGYPGTMGASFMDYLIADSTVIPNDEQGHYAEKIIRLPTCFLPVDSERKLTEFEFKRESFGLPASGFVFCCFNNGYKILPEMFDMWMRILSRASDSVLWLSRNNASASNNLLREALQRGIRPERLIFAERMPSHAEHLARHRIADLFLDTLPYNAHATAIDALWAGLPIVTLAGQGLAGRVTASLLKSLGLQELIATTENQYEEIALRLASSPEFLGDIKRRLAWSCTHTSALKTRNFTRYLESAYRMIQQRYADGLPPDHMQVQLDG